MEELLMLLNELEGKINLSSANWFLRLRSIMTDLELSLYYFLYSNTSNYVDKAANGLRLDDKNAILDITENKLVIAKIIALFETEKFPSIYNEVVKNTIDAMEDVSLLNKKYFDVIVKDRIALQRAITIANKTALNTFGIYQPNELTAIQKNTKGLFTKTTNGYYIKDDSYLGRKKLLGYIKGDIADSYQAAITNKTDFYKFRKEYLKSKTVSNWVTIKGEKALVSGGVIDKHYQVTAWETITGNRRIIQKETADELGIKYAIYQGTKRETSRPFCVGGNDNGITHSGMLHVIDSVDNFTKIADACGKWSGKYPRGFDITRACGGFRCYHYLRYISKDMYDHYLSLPTTRKHTHKPSGILTHKVV